MRYTALGMIETRGLVGAIEAADAAFKAAEVYMLDREFVKGGLVMVRFIGETASVQAAVDAGAAAAARVGLVVSTRVIPRLDDQAIALLGLRDPEDAEPAADLQYDSLTTPELRALARSIPDFPVRGRELNRLSKEQLIAELMRTHGKGHA